MRQEWEPEDLIEVWTLLEEDQERLRNKSGANRLGFALLLKFFEVEARFPEDAGEIPVSAVSYGAQQVCGTLCGGGRSGCRGRTGGGTRRTICRRTSRTTAMCTTTRSAGRRTRRSSSRPYRSGCARP
ncbi:MULTISPECIES: DUF4158 domain-containing protein [Streptomyces]|uniref:DUF4158 domain-containing protein n=1 Tax=Streptomyces TaxID=1883 RepID=UPI001676571D|nr:hypothetical protein GCM10010272_52590 [Streptomyces lateritius]